MKHNTSYIVLNVISFEIARCCINTIVKIFIFLRISGTAWRKFKLAALAFFLVFSLLILIEVRSKYLSVLAEGKKVCWRELRSVGLLWNHWSFFFSQETSSRRTHCPHERCRCEETSCVSSKFPVPFTLLLVYLVNTHVSWSTCQCLGTNSIPNFDNRSNGDEPTNACKTFI